MPASIPHPMPLPALHVADELATQEAPPHQALQTLRKHHPPEVAAWAWEMALVRQKAVLKGLDGLLFTREALEQATRQQLAAHRAKRFQGLGPLIELGAGCGADTLHLAQVAKGIAVELDPIRAIYLHHNLQSRNLSHEMLAVSGNAEQFAARHFACGFADPARREQGKRLLDLNAYSPSLARLMHNLPGPCAIKLAPAQNPDELFALANSAPVSLEWVGWLGELKELVLWRAIPLQGKRVVTLFPSGATLACDATQAPTWPEAKSIGNILYDPHPAVVRANLVGLLARQIDAFPLDSQIAFLSANSPTPTPFGRVLEVLEAFPFSLNNIRSALRTHKIGHVEIVKRGSAIDAVALKKSLKPQGDMHATLALARVGEKQMGILAKPLPGFNQIVVQ